MNRTELRITFLCPMEKSLGVFRYFLALSLAGAAACTTPTVAAPEPADSGAPTRDPQGSGAIPAAPPPSNAGAAAMGARKPWADAGPFDQAAHAAFPQIPANQGTVLAPTKIVTIVAANESLQAELLDFGDALVASHWWKEAGKDYGLTTATHVRITSAESITANVRADEMDAFIGRAIAGHAEAADNGSTMYMLYLPAGVVDVDSTQGVNTGCQYHAGYHAIGSASRVWGFGMRCPLQGTGLSELQSLTVVGSHEIIEAATDPEPGRGYTLGFLQSTRDDIWASTSGETGDLCVATQITEGLFTYQRVWSNSAAAAGGDPCVPALATPYYNVSTRKPWYSVAPGATLTIPLTGWSTGRVALDWIVEARVLKTTASGTGFTATMSSASTVAVKGVTYSAINNGRTATLTVVAPNQPGVYAVINVYDIPRSPGGDPYHFYPVGVYTP